MPSQLLFCVWCVLVNSFVHYFIFEFLFCITQKDGRRYLPIWLIVNGLITVIVTFAQLPGTFFIDVLVLLAFAKAVLKIPNTELVAPITIIFTFYTFMEGYSASIMSWVSSNFHSPTGGKMEQIFVPLLLDILFLGVLQIIKKRYSYTLRQSISSYLYILLLPCTLVVLLIRCGLKLDGRDFEQHLASFGVNARFAVLFTMLGATIIVVMMIETFCKIIQLTKHEKAAALLQSQLNGQRVYIEEAAKRNELYASFQHDIDNHLLVISGLLHDKQFAQAEQYTQKLHISCGKLLMNVSTGKPILDVLLKEKISYAKRNHIAVSHDVAIPSDFSIDDMDLCVLFSNILDNAITACIGGAEEEHQLSLSVKVKSQFLLVEAVNTTSASQPIVWGTGLMNIQHMAEKYHGTVETELSNGKFRISVLLCSH